MTTSLFTPLKLPNGSTLPNRIAKAAMEENLSDAGQLPGPALWRLYSEWGSGGAGLLITGNVMIDARALTGPGGVVLERDTPLEPFRRWAAGAREHGARIWMQINHPGRQVYAALSRHAWAPSSVPLDLGRHSKLFAEPQEMSVAQIHEVIERFADTAAAAEMAGFDGVQIHAAHGYLISQFLSPLTNRRSDAWGGSLENRARLLLSVVQAVRGRVGAGFGVGIKINSADFQRGGFSELEARQIVLWLNASAVDLIELSGGSYERWPHACARGIFPHVCARHRRRRRDAGHDDGRHSPAAGRRSGIERRSRRRRHGERAGLRAGSAESLARGAAHRRAARSGSVAGQGRCRSCHDGDREAPPARDCCRPTPTGLLFACL